jgi:tRNA pseudouridine38-40 synthase
MRNISMKISYDGTLFNGFQNQPNMRTVQGQIERVLCTIAKQPISIYASGRTDAGVHARGQVIHFLSDLSIPIERVPLAFNSRLPEDIVVLEAYDMDEQFHSRHLAKKKTYRYTIDNGKFQEVFGRQYRLHVPQKLNREHMKQALNYVVGTHDFTSFTSVRSDKPHHVRTIYEAKFIDEGNFIHIELTGNGFTYNMVRIITGTLLKIGFGQKKPEDMLSIIQGCDRSLAGPTALPIGLCLMNVAYD